MHQDQSFSVNSLGPFESETPIVDISLGSTRKMVITGLQAPSGSKNYGELQPHIIHEFAFQHGDMFVMEPGLNTMVKHGVPADSTVKGLRVSIVVRAVDKQFVSPEGGFWTVQGDVYHIGNKRTKLGDVRRFVLQPNVSMPLNVQKAMKDEPCMSEDDRDELAPLFDECAHRRFNWGSSSDYNGCSWPYVASRADYNAWISTKAKTRPDAFGEFESFRGHIMRSDAFGKVLAHFQGNQSEAWGYIYMAWLNGFFAAKRVKLLIGHLEPGVQKLAALDLEQLNEIGVSKQILGKNYKELLKDPHALEFATWALAHSSAVHSRSTTPAPSLGSLPGLSVEPVAEEGGDLEVEEALEPEVPEPVAPAPKAKAKANAAKRPRVA